MNKLIAALLTAFCSLVFAQSGGTSPNLIGQNNLTGVVNTTSTGQGYSGGSTPGYNASTNTIMFGYNQNTVAYTYAFSQALRDSGMTITGYNYSWDYLNQYPNNGTLSAAVNFAGTNGTSLHYKGWTLGPTTDWVNVSGTEAFANSGLLASSISNFSLSFTGKDARWWAGYYGPMVRNASLSLNYTFDVCSSNPLSSPSCPGYAAAYMTQQCTANPLYNASCPGYAAAYMIQQCTINSLYDPTCPGYASAYLNYQCSVNPLYATTCQGYEQAYFNQQCTANPLYNASCPGYDAAYLTQQCNANPLYSTSCTGYVGAYFSQQCTANPLYDKQCPAYAQAYALKNVVVTTPKVATPVPVTTTESPAAVAIVADPVVNETVTATATSASPAQSATATVPLVVAPAVTTTTTAAPPPAPVQAEAPKEQPKTARQEMQAKRENAARTAAVERGKNLANEMGKAADMESQKQVQNVVIQAMGFTPGFDAYGKVMVPDSVGYKPFTVYNNQKNVDNRRLGWGLYGPSDRLHNDLVNSQYKD